VEALGCFGDGSVGQTVHSFLVCCVFLWVVQDDSHDFLEEDGGVGPLFY
jgi:hypothetical protein